ncbi:MAG: hypothetical protein GY953_26860 [bacterium]|nr:hypothetical protein [bacterium]
MNPYPCREEVDHKVGPLMKWCSIAEKIDEKDAMTQLTIDIPDDLASRLKRMAAAQNKSLDQVAVERLRSLVRMAGSPEAVLQTMTRPPHVSAAAVDDIEAAVAADCLPVRVHQREQPKQPEKEL